MVHVSGVWNSRVQSFKKVTLEDNAKAIIVSGGGPFQGNHLWPATQSSANFAYRTLTFQGIDKETIYYLSSDTELDLDGNGVADDVDADATNANLQDAIINWAADGNSVTLYMVDHGGDNTFRMGGSETLQAAELNSWLDTLQESMSGRLTVIYDACESGSFIQTLSSGGESNRVVLASTSPDESAVFVSNGAISFSNYLWTHIFNGVDLKSSFELASSALTSTTDHQHPLVDADGDGVGNEAIDLTLVTDVYVGSGSNRDADAPAIGSISPEQLIEGTNTATVYADDVPDPDGVARVWAVVRIPNYQQADPSNPIQELPGFDLAPVGNDRYEFAWDGFNSTGTYQIAIYSADREGNTSIPQLTTVIVDSPITRKAIVVNAGEESDPGWSMFDRSAVLAYEALRQQGYQDDDIQYLSDVASSGVDATPTLANVEFAITNWAANQTQDVVLFFVGAGGIEQIRLNATEQLTAERLDTWIGALEAAIPGNVVIVLESDYSGSFVTALRPPGDETRIIVTGSSSSEYASFLAGGEISFARFFWRQVLNGATVRDALLHAERAVDVGGLDQTPQLSADGNSTANEKADKRIARGHRIGTGILFAGDEPLIGSAMPDSAVESGTSLTLWVDEVSTTGTIDSVWAVITEPGNTASETFPLTWVVDRYEGDYDGFSRSGQYGIAFYAEDTNGNVSLPLSRTVTQASGPDQYEDDNQVAEARLIVVDDKVPQIHGFHTESDQDWVRFYVEQGRVYEVKVEAVSSEADVAIELYASDGTTILKDADGKEEGEGELISREATDDGVLYARVTNVAASFAGASPTYELSVYRPGAAFGGVDVAVSQGLAAVTIATDQIVDVTVLIENLGGQLADNTARHIGLRTYLTTGLLAVGEVPDGCSIADNTFNCSVDDIADGDSHSLTFAVQLVGEGRNEVTSSAYAYEDETRTQQSPDDRRSNNTHALPIAITAEDGVDTQSGSEYPDFNGDGSSDILWRNATTGSNIIWFMNDGARTSARLIQTIPEPWILGGQSDFDGDGTTDLLWRNTEDGRNLMWFFTDGSRSSSGLAPSAADVAWQIAATPDMDGDGKSDILWRLPDGRNIVWFMEGSTRRDARLLHTVSTDWDLGGAGDFDGDGNDDLLWHRPADGRNIVWLMGLTGRQQAILIHASTLLLAGIADFDSGGSDDILWRDTDTGRNILWFMASGERESYALLPSATDLTWHVAALKDFNGDGKADIHWRTEDGRNILWFMDGGTRTGAALTYSVVDNAWDAPMAVTTVETGRASDGALLVEYEEPLIASHQPQGGAASSPVPLRRSSNWPAAGTWVNWRDGLRGAFDVCDDSSGPCLQMGHLADDHGNHTLSATRVDAHSTTVGVLDYPGDRDFFAVTVETQSVLTVETTGPTDTQGTLYDVSGRQVTAECCAGSGDNFQITELIEAGTYFIRVDAGLFAGDAGDYVLRVEAAGD